MAKSRKINNQQNESKLKEEVTSLQTDKAGEYPPSLNKINKNSTV